MEIRTRLVNYMKGLGDKDLCVAFSQYVDGNWKLSFDMGSNKFIRSGQVFRCMECIFLFF